jgi:hypothetical protein
LLVKIKLRPWGRGFAPPPEEEKEEETRRLFLVVLLSALAGSVFAQQRWERNYGGAGDDQGSSVQQTTDGGYIVAGYTNSFGNGTQVYLVKTDANGNVGVETARVRGQRLEVRITATPNPFTSFATLPGHEAERFSLYDISGRKVGTCRGDRVGEGLAPGVYFLRSSDSRDKPLRIVKVR